MQRMRRYVRVGLGVAFALATLLLVDWRGALLVLDEAVGTAISAPAIAVAVVGQTTSLATCAAALRVLSPRLGWRAAFLSRWVRDGVGALPVGVPGLGEAAGLRPLSLFGASAAVAVAITTADVLAETLAQAVYAISAVLLAPTSLRVSPPSIHLPLVPLALALTGIAAAGIWVARRTRPAWRSAVRSVLALVGDSLRSKAFSASFGLHLLAWLAGGVQIYALAKCLGAPLSLPQSLSLEGLVFAIRSAAFFVPAGAGVQELSLATVGAAYGLAPIDIAAFAVLLRLRDLLVLSPALLIWLVFEARGTALAVPQAKSGRLPCS